MSEQGTLRPELLGPVTSPWFYQFIRKPIIISNEEEINKQTWKITTLYLCHYYVFKAFVLFILSLYLAPQLLIEGSLVDLTARVPGSNPSWTKHFHKQACLGELETLNHLNV